MKNPSDFEKTAAPEVADQPFWLDTTAIDDVYHLIMRASLPTMALGAETHANDGVEIRDDLKGIFAQDERDGINRELSRAIDIGFLYGSLIAQYHHRRHKAPDAEPVSRVRTPESRLNPEFRHDIINAAHRASHGSRHDGDQLFTELRLVEIKHGGSDVLAFAMSATGPHLEGEFGHYHKGRSLSYNQHSRIQATFYAGTLTGALTTLGGELVQGTPVELIHDASKHELPETTYHQIEETGLVRAIAQIVQQRKTDYLQVS